MTGHVMGRLSDVTTHSTSQVNGNALSESQSSINERGSSNPKYLKMSKVRSLPTSTTSDLNSILQFVANCVVVAVARTLAISAATFVTIEIWMHDFSKQRLWPFATHHFINLSLDFLFSGLIKALGCDPLPLRLFKLRLAIVSGIVSLVWAFDNISLITEVPVVSVAPALSPSIA